MATRNIRWNFPVADNRVFVHSNFGSDEYGDGSHQHPWRTLTHAVITKKASTNAYADDIVCVGYFSEDLPRLDNYTTTYGYGRTIRGNSFGEAVFDGKNLFNMWGYYTSNLVIMHCTSNRDSLNRASGFVGVGVSNNAYNADPCVRRFRLLCRSTRLLHSLRFNENELVQSDKNNNQ